MSPEKEYMFNQIKEFKMTECLIDNTGIYKTWTKEQKSLWHEYSKNMIDLQIDMNPECYYKAMAAKERMRSLNDKIV